jgi:hypothetical protein
VERLKGAAFFGRIFQKSRKKAKKHLTYQKSGDMFKYSVNVYAYWSWQVDMKEKRKMADDLLNSKIAGFLYV